jgi:hypothetical protein
VQSAILFGMPRKKVTGTRWKTRKDRGRGRQLLVLNHGSARAVAFGCTCPKCGDVRARGEAERRWDHWSGQREAPGP